MNLEVVEAENALARDPQDAGQHALAEARIVLERSGEQIAEDLDLFTVVRVKLPHEARE
jgi:hypothetical protein